MNDLDAQKRREDREAADTQVQSALGDLPQTRSDLREQARDSSGLKSRILVGVEQRLERLPRVESLVDEGAEVGLVAVEVFVGIFFVLATAAGTPATRRGSWSSGRGPRISCAGWFRESTRRRCATLGT